MSARSYKPDGPLPLPSAAGTGFGALVGQAAVTTALRNALTRGRLPHALLFSGPEGVGKATCAGVLARAINCLEEVPGDACGSCAACTKIARGYHPDVVYVYPLVKGQGTSRLIRISQITSRETASSDPRPPHQPITEVVGYAPHEGRARVVVIDEAHLMNDAAQNALLKTLEEPPPGNVIVLVTSRPAELLPTIHSRCLELGFSPVPQSEVRRYLEQERGLEPDEARQRAALSPGSIGRALAVDLDAYAEMVEQVVDALRAAQHGPAGVIAAADSLSGLGDGATAIQKAVDTLGVGRNVLRDLLVVATGADTSSLVHPDRVEAWQAWSSELDPDRIGEALAALNVGIDRFSGIPPSVKLALEHTLIDVHRALAGEPVVAGARTS